MSNAYEVLLIDNPAPMVRRITLNRPEKRNALSAALRKEIIDAVQEGDQDPAVRVTIIRGAGSCFSAGYDLSPEASYGGPQPTSHFTAGGLASFQRHVIGGWMSSKRDAPFADYRTKST